MFGDKDIMGLKTISVDSKARIVLPKFTYVEPNDELVFYELNRKSFIIASLELLKRRIIELKSIGDQISINLIEKQIDDIYATIIGVTKADKQNRVFIPEIIRENFLPFNYRKEKGNVVAQGYGNKLKIFLNTEEFIQKQKEI